MNIEHWAVTAASLTALITAGYEVAVRGGRHTRRIIHAVETIERHSVELLPNHGSSLRDQVDRIAVEQNRHSAALSDHGALLAQMHSDITRIAITVADQAGHPTPTPGSPASAAAVTSPAAPPENR